MVLTVLLRPCFQPSQATESASSQKLLLVGPLAFLCSESASDINIKTQLQKLSIKKHLLSPVPMVFIVALHHYKSWRCCRGFKSAQSQFLWSLKYQDYQVCYGLQNLLCVSLSRDFIHSLVIESKQRRCCSAGPPCLTLTVHSDPNPLEVEGIFISFQQILKRHLFSKGHERQDCRETREMANFHTSRLIMYNKHQLKAYRSFFGRRAVSC